MSSIETQLVSKNIFLLPELKDEQLVDLGLEKSGNALFTEIGYVKQADFDNLVDNMFGNIKKPIPAKSVVSNEERVYLYTVYCSKLYELFLKGRHYSPIADQAMLSDNE